ncbi:hypothetical protein GGX14DRAFT_697882 [Mycena pura]|uniref:Uncharacterized protein n=1 Tax=Mycena pura TaxID=153505 RepID=A0AAD6YEN3_9AGAR|nr:hypothetical protein GGX14DRAFT_697882 [Mycena pura]
MHLGVSSSILHKPLYTFLVTTVLLLSIFVVMGVRSLFRRRRRRRRRRPVATGPWVLLAPRETDAADLGKAPRLWDVHLAPPRAHTGMDGWNDIMPFAASCIPPASAGITGLSLPSSASTSAPPAAVARTLVSRNSTQAVNGPRPHQSRAHVAVLIAMPMPVPVMPVSSAATAALLNSLTHSTTAMPILSSKSSSGGYPLVGTPPTWIPDHESSQPHTAPLSSTGDGTGAGAGYVFAADCVPEPLRRLMPALEVGLVDVGVVPVPMAAPAGESAISNGWTLTDWGW